MSGFFEQIGVDTTNEELNQTTTVSEGGLLKPGVYVFTIDKAYASKSSGGATRVEAELKYTKEDGSEGTFFWSTYVTSGDEKGNKTTYVGKDGKEHPLPGLIEFRKFCKMAGVENPQVKDATIEKFGEQIAIKAFPELTGKKIMAGVRHQYDDYKEKDIAFIDTFLKADGTNETGEQLADKLKAKIEKNPYKESKKKEEKKAPEVDVSAQNSPW